jgi:hypothetical protein
MVKDATYALNKRHHETKEGTITVDVEAIFKTAFLTKSRSATTPFTVVPA